MNLMRAHTILMVSLIICVGQGHTGASLFVDDASITPAGQCQVESWARAYSPGQELTVAPACDVQGTELGIGVSQFSHPEAGPVWSVGAKRLFRDFDQHSWGLGASVSAVWNADTRSWDAGSITLPISVALREDKRLVMHANIGWIDRTEQNNSVLAGIGLELVLASSFTFLAEAYGERNGADVGQLGLRFAVGDASTIDLLVGHQIDSENSPWLTLGFNMPLPR